MSVQELLDQIRRGQGSFPASQRLVAAYVLENYHQIPFLTISALAKNIGVSNNTIVKFCDSIGYKKYTEFKKVLSDYAHSELIMLNKLSEGPDTDDDGLLTAEELEEDISNIRSTLNDPHNRSSLPALVERIGRADHIYIIGGRASASMASILTNELRYLGLRVHDVSCNTGDYLDALSLVQKNDLLIAFSFPRYTASVLQGIELVRGCGAPIAVITDTGLSPALPYADLSLHCAITSNSYFTSLAGCLSLVNLICRSCAAARKKNAMNHISRLERLLLENEIFR